MRRDGITSGLAVFAAGFLLLEAGIGMAAAADADAAREGTMIKRLFSYDRALRNSEKVVVLVVAADRTMPGLEDTITAFRANGLFPAIVTPADLSSEDLTATLTRESTVVFVTGDSGVAEIRDFATEKGFLTVSVLPVLAEAGDVSVSVTVEGDRPEIVVNLPRLQAEGHELSSELLSLARVIR